MDSDVIPSAASVEARTERIIKKVPGKIPPTPKEKEIFTGNLKSKSTVDLKELLDRQKRILSNKLLVNKLADKGAKAVDLKARIDHELKSRDEVDKTAGLLSEMNLGQLNALEWTGRCNPGHRTKPSPCEEDSVECDETDPLKIIASHCGATARKKQISTIKPDESLIKLEDLIDSAEDRDSDESLRAQADASSETLTEKNLRPTGPASPKERNSGSSQKQVSPEKMLSSTAIPFLPGEPEPYSHFICERFGHKEFKERFKPNKPLKPFSGEFPFKPPGRVSSKPKRWEETNVTPPLPIHGDTKLLSLEESIEIQRTQNQKLREVQIKHAAEKLGSFQGIRMAEQLPSNVLRSMAYRGPAESDIDSDEEMNEADLEDQEHHDEDQLEKGGTVVYNIES